MKKMREILDMMSEEKKFFLKMKVVNVCSVFGNVKIIKRVKIFVYVLKMLSKKNFMCERDVWIFEWGLKYIFLKILKFGNGVKLRRYKSLWGKEKEIFDFV